MLNNLCSKFLQQVSPVNNSNINTRLAFAQNPFGVSLNHTKFFNRKDMPDYKIVYCAKCKKPIEISGNGTSETPKGKIYCSTCVQQ